MKTLKISLPKDWNNLTDRQLRKVAVLFNSVQWGVLFDVALLQILLNIRWWQLRRKARMLLLLRNVTLTELKKHFAYLYNAQDRTVFIEYMITKDEAFFSPQARLQNLSAEEFAIAEDLHRVWHKNHERTALEYMAAVLYSTAPNIRPPFFKTTLEDKAALFKTVPMEDLLAMELVYRGCKDYIAKKYPKAFPVAKGGVGGKVVGFGAVIQHMAARSIFGDHEKTRGTNIYFLLDQFEEDLVNQSKEKKHGQNNIA